MFIEILFSEVYWYKWFVCEMEIKVLLHHWLLKFAKTWELKVYWNKVLVIFFREGILRKRAGGHRFPAGCCSCCAGLSWGIWDKRYHLAYAELIHVVIVTELLNRFWKKKNDLGSAVLLIFWNAKFENGLYARCRPVDKSNLYLNSTLINVSTEEH